MNKRLFVALDPPSEISQQLSSLNSALPGARWTSPEQLHLTLCFIGEVSSAVYTDICETLADIQSPPLQLRLQGMGFFPPRQEPRVLWVGIEANPQLLRLQRKIEEHLRRLRLPLEKRKFTPHITVARLQDCPSNWLGRYLQSYNTFSSAPFLLDHFCLYSSVLGRKGAQHFVEQEYWLE